MATNATTTGNMLFVIHGTSSAAHSTFEGISAADALFNTLYRRIEGTWRVSSTTVPQRPTTSPG